MICAKCGANVPDGVKFCGVCGQPMPVAEAPVAAAPVAPVAAPAKKGNPMLLVIVAVVAAVAVLLGCLLLFGGSGAEAAFEDYFDVYFKGDFSNIENLMPELTWTKYVAENENAMAAEVLADNDSFGTLWLTKNFDDPMIDVESYDYKVLAVDEWEDADVLEYNQDDDRLYMIEEGCTLYVEITYETTAGDEVATVRSYSAYKYDGDWYLTNGSSVVSNIVYAISSND